MSPRSSRELRRRLKAPAPEVPPELLQRLKEAIPEERFGEAPNSPVAKPSRSSRAWGQREWGIAAGLVMLVASGLLAIRIGLREATSEGSGSRDQGEPIDAVAAEVRQERRMQERKDHASEPTAPAPAAMPLSEVLESDDEGAEVPTASAGSAEAAQEDFAGGRENAPGTRGQPSRAQRSKADAPMASSEKVRAEAKPVADAVAKKEAPSAHEEAPSAHEEAPSAHEEAPMALVESAEPPVESPEPPVGSPEAPLESRLRTQVRPSQAPAESESLSRETQRVATASSAAPAAFEAQGAALESFLAIRVLAQKVERGAWQLEGTVGESGARPDFADAAGSFALRLVSASESALRLGADRDLAAQEIAQDTAQEETVPADRRDGIRAAVGPNGGFSLRIPCDAILPSEETIVLELVDEKGTPLERVELPTPAACATRGGEPQ